MWNTVFFDLDGTLTDSGEGITKCVQYALQKEFGIEVRDLHELDFFVGPPLKDSFMQYANLSDAEGERAVAAYRERYSRTGIYENRLYGGISSLLASLSGEGFRLAVTSSKPTDFCVQILRYFGVAHYFSLILGSEMNGRRVRKAEVIEEALLRLGMQERRSEVVLIGDRKYDVEGAKAAGISSIGVTYGYGSREELEKAWPDCIVDNTEELKNVLIGQLRAEKKTGRAFDGGNGPAGGRVLNDQRYGTAAQSTAVSQNAVYGNAPYRNLPGRPAGSGNAGYGQIGNSAAGQSGYYGTNYGQPQGRTNYGQAGPDGLNDGQPVNNGANYGQPWDSGVNCGEPGYNGVQYGRQNAYRPAAAPHYAARRVKPETPLGQEQIFFKLWRIVYPILIDLGISNMASVIVGMFVAVWFGVQAGLTGQMPNPVAINELLTKHMMAIYCFATAAVIPVLWILFKKDEEKRGRQADPGSFLLKKRGMSVMSVICILIFTAAGARPLNLISDMIPESNSMYEELLEGMNNASPVILLLSVSILAPLAEELLFRGLIYRRARDYFGMWPAAVISGVSFALMHGNLKQGIVTLFMGFAMALLYEHYGTLAAPLIVHIFNNFTASFVDGLLYKNVPHGVEYLITAAAIVITIPVCWYIFKKESRVNRI